MTQPGLCVASLIVSRPSGRRVNCCGEHAHTYTRDNRKHTKPLVLHTSNNSNPAEPLGWSGSAESFQLGPVMPDGLQRTALTNIFIALRLYAICSAYGEHTDTFVTHGRLIMEEREFFLAHNEAEFCGRGCPLVSIISDDTSN